MRHFQHVILGTGQATGTLLGALLPTGDSIAVIEGDRVSGTCVNTGCTPTKALVAAIGAPRGALQSPLAIRSHRECRKMVLTVCGDELG